MPEPRAAFQDVEARLWPSISAAMPAPKPPKARGRVWAYLMGWISPQWPKADPRVCHALEAELGLEHQPEFMPESPHMLQRSPWIQFGQPRIISGLRDNLCAECGKHWDSYEDEYLCDECRDAALTEVEKELGLEHLLEHQPDSPLEPIYQTIRE